MKPAVLFIVLVFTSVDALKASPDRVKSNNGRIIGGEVINIFEAPFQVAILYTEALWAGGSILSENFILSDAHDFYLWNSTSQTSHLKVDIDDLEIRAGSSTYFSAGQVVQVHSIIHHPNYQSFDYDVAILTAKTPLTLSSSFNVVPVNLPSSSINISVGTPATMTGWGKTEFDVLSPVLKRIHLQILDAKVCTEESTDFTERMLCTISSNMDSAGCDYELGGPLVQNGTHLLLGLFTDSTGCRLTTPQLYTNIAHPEIRQFIFAYTGL